MNRNTSTFGLILLIAVGFVSTQVATPLLNKDCIESLKPLYLGNCSSDYAVVAAAAVELGWCLKDPSNADLKGIAVSAQDIMCKCTICHSTQGNGCGGGFIEKALQYLKNGGVGGSYNKRTANTKTTITGGPTNYRDCLNYWSDICDPSEESCIDNKFDLARMDPTHKDTYCPSLNCNRQSSITIASAQTPKFLDSYTPVTGKDNMILSLSK